MSPATPGARELTRRLVAREAAQGDAPDIAAGAVHAACERAYQALSRWLGANGALALFTRALAQAQAGHPLLRNIRLRTRSEFGLEGVTESIQVHGAAAVAAGLESLLVALLELLGRLVGDDMAARLVEQSVPSYAQDDESPR
ncbi:MAG: hypothetical protein M3373_14485 [Gemmatimonadota bacterium]|nr:hypothetical protein [Gemmatimonadota bacterium]